MAPQNPFFTQMTFDSLNRRLKKKKEEKFFVSKTHAFCKLSIGIVAFRKFVSLINVYRRARAPQASTVIVNSDYLQGYCPVIHGTWGAGVQMPDS